MNNTEKIVKEITEFHQDIEKWFQGTAEDRDLLYKKLLSGFSPEFKMINGNGYTVTLSAFSDWLPTVFGKFPERTVYVENIKVWHSDHHGLATYTEVQITGESSNKRQSSGIFLLHPEKALWFHLVEKWI
ncbi:hypothetical protein C1631_001190 [Chryseobacterium phosphatilyticum]|uniref:DUF4440 domain-containing protein n=1 Tax=Chryseobacterium phosphatilyticum TaxID=475075 RepID=A0A316XIP5_9FLAO|nr:hypothetical protein [Chryseobacterium phosphatilyticum]PWN71268.1 hypothetical protein C1631_001190 [Chryseobacterium phosphatilyticum]